MRLLLVEDDHILGSSLTKALEKHAYGVDWLQDGESALAALSDCDFAAAILDINLPKMNGLDVLKATRRKKNMIPILVLTARDTSLQRVEGLDSGADDYLVKPFDLDELLARLRALIRRSQGRVETVLKCRNVEIDPAATVVRKSGKQALYSAENVAESNTTEVAIYSLRKKLGSEFIKSIRGVGYMIEA